MTMAAHLQVLQHESRKKEPNVEILAEKLSKTYRARRIFISENFAIDRVFDEYPALKITSMVSFPI